MPSKEEAQEIITWEEAKREPDNEFDRRKERIAQALVAAHPTLKRFVIDYEEIAKFHQISPEEARLQYRHIELDSPEDEPAIQITIYDEYVAINVPYWYEGEDAVTTFQQISEYLRIIRREAGYFIYDPQTDRAYDPDQEDFENIENYENITKQLPEIINEFEKSNIGKPWWKFW